MLASTCSRRLASVSFPARCYATQSKKKKSSAKSSKPSSSSSTPTPTFSLKTRLTMAASKNYQSFNARPFGEHPSPATSEEEEQLRQIEALEEQKKYFESQGREVLGIQMPMLDLMLPYAVGPRYFSEYPSMRAMYRQWLQNRINDGKNAFSMRHIGVSDAFPGVQVDPRMGWFRAMFTFSRRVFQAQSLKSTAWVSPMRQEFLDRYIKLNQAIMHNEKLADLAMPPYADDVATVSRKRTAGNLYFWKFHREVSPTRILSLRAVDGDFGKEMPVTGTRIAVQALVRFDTEQSVEIYDRNGKALHELGPTGEQQPARLGKTLHRLPATPKRVTEYLVLDRAMYLANSKWRFRAQLEALPGRTVAV